MFGDHRGEASSWNYCFNTESKSRPLLAVCVSRNLTISPVIWIVDLQRCPHFEDLRAALGKGRIGPSRNKFKAELLERAKFHLNQIFLACRRRRLRFLKLYSKWFWWQGLGVELKPSV